MEAGLSNPVRISGDGLTRSVEDALRDHLHAVNTGDVQAILEDYADDSVILTAQGALEGKRGVEAFFTQAFSLLPEAKVSAKSTVMAGDALIVWWTAESPAGRVDDGVDTFVVEDGLIKLRSSSFTPQLNE
jgi:ketosteroid isomerase-like protein